MLSFLLLLTTTSMSTLLVLSTTSLAIVVAQSKPDVPDFSAANGFSLNDVIGVLGRLRLSLNEGLDGISPPELQPGSDLFLLRNEVIAVANEILTLSAQQVNERDLLELATMGMDQGPLNFGQTAGMGNLTRSPDILDVSCYGAFPFRCYENDRYRTISGICNNLENPLWGSTGSRLRRFIPAEYSDGFQEPRGGRDSASGQCGTGNQKPSKCTAGKCVSDPTRLLPNPRYVSVNFHPDVNVNSNQATAMFTQFAQFLAHDITLTPEEAGVVNCCDGSQCFYSCPQPSGGQSNGLGCFPIDIPCRDPCFSPSKPLGELGRTSCLQFIRSAPFCQGQNGTVREQMNGVTSFIDASNVYGSTQTVSQSLRTFANGQMKVSFNNLLPIIDGVFTAGDVRARQVPGLTSLHTIFLREHNRVAHQLLKNSSLVGCTDEKLYQEARRIVIAEMQNVVYSEFLPQLYGVDINYLPYYYNYYYYYYYLYSSPPAYSTYKLPLNFYDSYNPQEDPTIRNGFATAAFRFGHSMIQDLIQLYSLDSFSQKSAFPLKDNFFDTTHYKEDDGQGMEEILLGLVAQDAKQFDQFVVEDVTNFLFANLDKVGSDLIARNIQRGRDHGLGSYTAYREYVGLPSFCTWDSPPYKIPIDRWQQLRTIYDDPSDIDLFVGGLAEDPVLQGVLGPTFNRLIGEQFEHLKFGDRFFFTFQQDNPHPFTDGQISLIRQRKLSDIICDNAEYIQRLPYHVFNAASAQQCQFGGNYCNVCGSHFQLDPDLLTSS